MIINLAVEIPEATMLMALKRRGHVVVSHDFGDYKTEYHNRPVWHSDVQPAVMVDQYPYRIHEAFVKVFSFEIKTNVARELSKLTYKAF